MLFVMQLHAMLLMMVVATSIAICAFADQNAVVTIQAETNNDVTVDDNDDDNGNQETFVPTKEWQKIKPGQSIPAGLHIKLNLGTGAKEAKILESGKISGHHYKIQENEGDQGKGKSFSPQELKEALKKFKTDEMGIRIGSKEKVGKAKFRNMDELKKEFRHLKLNIQSESEILIDLIQRYKTATENDKSYVLQDIEYIVHQYDAAQDFVKLQGLDVIIPDLNSTISKIREMAAFVMGSAMQGNPQVQIAVLERNALQKLLRLVAFDPSTLVRARALYAISCLVRQFPFAQTRLIENGGFGTFAQLFKDLRPDMQILQLKVVVLLHDLVLEQQLAVKYSTKLIEENEKHQQHSRLNLASSIVENNFCQLVPMLLPSPDYDTQEKVIVAMLIMVDACGTAFLNKLSTLRQLAERYRTALAQDHDDYIDSLYRSVASLISKVERAGKDEL